LALFENENLKNNYNKLIKKDEILESRCINMENKYSDYKNKSNNLEANLNDTKVK
jgi:hypothetical protein